MQRKLKLPSVFTLASGRRAKWVIVLFWAVVVVFAVSAAPKFQNAQNNDPSTYLPGNSGSAQALAQIERLSHGQAITEAVVVFSRPERLKAGDLRLITADRLKLDVQLPRTGVPSRRLFLSPDRKAAVLVFGLRVHNSTTALTNQVQEIRNVVQRTRPGLEVNVTGPAGSGFDAEQVFNEINGTLLLVTVATIFILLVLIYRSPIFWLIPLAAVGVAEVTSEGLGYLLTQIGVTVNGESAAILTVLVFGAGTDYALLLVSRYREELLRRRDTHEAMRVALQRSGPVIFASSSTVILALLCLLAAQVNSTRGLGPIAAMGVGVALLSGLTLLPSLLLIAGRRAFWPFVPHQTAYGAPEVKRGIWRRVAGRVDRRHRPIALAATALLVLLCLGLTSLNGGLDSGNSFRNRVESTRGQTILAAHFPAGASSPLEVIVPDLRRVLAVRAALVRVPGVAPRRVALGPVLGRPGDFAFTLTLTANPSSQRAFDLIPRLRAVATAAGGRGTLIGGATAEEVDQRAAAVHDTILIIPLILLVVFLILTLLLRALVAPALLIATVLLSFGAALGAGAFLFQHVFGYPGEDPSLTLFTFLFLVALGVDYNIFLMARVREETLISGTRQGVVKALEVTGPVITSAGIVLAGTFAALASLPLIGFTELGFVIAFGVLVDTFLVRTILVPALVIEIDRRVWWPSALARAAGRKNKPPAPARVVTNPWSTAPHEILD
jgi:RND superfamily putative drug exporter